MEYYYLIVLVLVVATGYIISINLLKKVNRENRKFLYVFQIKRGITKRGGKNKFFVTEYYFKIRIKWHFQKLTAR